MRQGSMALMGKIFRRNNVPYLVIDEATERDRMLVRRIDGTRQIVEMASADILERLHTPQQQLA